MQRVVVGLILACSVAFAAAQMPSPGALTAQADNAGEQDAASLLARARDSYQAGNAREAIALAERALAIAVQRFGAEDPLTIGIINALGIFNYADGRYGEAVTLFERALPIADQHAGAEHPLTISIVNNLAALMLAQGQYRQALPMFERALAIREATAGAEHADTAAVLNNLGTVQEALGNLLSARTHLRACARNSRKGAGTAASCCGDERAQSRVGAPGAGPLGARAIVARAGARHPGGDARWRPSARGNHHEQPRASAA